MLMFVWLGVWRGVSWRARGRRVDRNKDAYLKRQKIEETASKHGMMV